MIIKRDALLQKLIAAKHDDFVKIITGIRPDEAKMQQETFSLKHTGDNFRKVVIAGSPFATNYVDTDGIGHVNLIDFLLNPKLIETI